MRRRKSFNPKRRICGEDEARARLQKFAAANLSPRYSGNPEHKRNPGDFGLEPPSSPRLGKSLCDAVKIYTRGEASELLTSAFLRGLFSIQEREGWPQNVWAVTVDGHPVEAQLEGAGIYHGYPMPAADPFRDEILARWERV